MKNTPVILVVDDQIKNIELLEAFLIPQGYEILRAQSGDEALCKLTDNSIDLILLDVMMPGMDGLQFIQSFRALHGLAEIPVLMITAEASKYKCGICPAGVTAHWYRLRP